METKTFTTSDLPLAAYLVTKGLLLKKAQRLPGGKFEFVIEDKDEVAKELAIEYVNSEFCKFDNTIRSIKKILYTK